MAKENWKIPSDMKDAQKAPKFATSLLVASQPIHNRGILLSLGIIFLVTYLVFLPVVPSKFAGYTRPTYISTPLASGVDFNWQGLPPSPDLNWVSCYSGRECARLEVPLDYSVPNGEKAAIALIRLKSSLSRDSKEYRGPVLFNPGGPGGSGVAFINSSGDSFQKILGGAFDIVGFDPRGVGQTTPPVSIFPDEVERQYWNAGATPLLNSTPDAISQSFFRATLFNNLVVDRSYKAAQHVSTAVVSRDMLSIIKAHGRDRLQYWGVSYGTILGATYAAMFPNNIERMVIDGVVDFDDYYSGLGITDLLDTDKSLQILYDKCASAGVACPLNAQSGSLVKERVNSLLASLKITPIPAINGSEHGLVDFSIVKRGLLLALYSPFSSFPPLSAALAALEKGDGRPFLTLWRTIQPIVKCDTPPRIGGSREESQRAVACGEAARVAHSMTDIMKHFEELSKISVFADVWTDITETACVDWGVKAAEIFAGPFASNTSFPLLVIGNTADPVTPISSARKAVRTFAGSVLLTIDTPGHTSLAATSLCAAKVVNEYFNQGILPQEGTVCGIEDVLFGSDKPLASRNLTRDDAELLEGSKTLRGYFGFPGTDNARSG